MDKIFNDKISNIEEKLQIIENKMLIPICESCELPVFEEDILGGDEEDPVIICKNCCHTPNLVNYVCIGEYL